MLEKLQSDLEGAWGSIENDVDKIDAGFSIAASLAKFFRDSALKYLERAEQLRGKVGFDQGLGTYIANVRLTIRAFAGLLPGGIDRPEDLVRVSDCIERIPALSKRIEEWAVLAMRYFREARDVDGRRIVNEHLIPLLGMLEGTDPDEWENGVLVSSPVLYLASQIRARETIAKMAPHLRDQAYDSIFSYLLKRVAPNEPFETRVDSRFQVTFDTAIEVCALLSEAEGDGLIYCYLRWLVESALWRENQFTQSQKSDIARRLSLVIESKLPAPRYIQHDGYKIIALAEVGRLQKPPQAFWEDLVNSARRIANLADKCMVLALLAREWPVLGQAKSQLFREAKSIADSIPSLADRVDRYEIIADAASNSDRPLSELCLHEALKALASTDDQDLAPVQRRLVDLAYRISPDLASKLASSLDDDPARASVRSRIKERTALHCLKEKMAEARDETLEDPAVVSKAAWMLLGSLNAGRVTPIKVSLTRGYIRLASGLPLSAAYPILSWVIENANSRISRTSEAKTTLRAFFEATLLGCELSIRVGTRATRKLQRISSILAVPHDLQSLIVRSGERAKGIEYLKSWLQERTKEFLYLADPYFGLEDLTVLQLVLAGNRDLRVEILTSKKRQDETSVPPPWDEAYRSHWRHHISDQKPPETRITVVGGSATGQSPIHDRWWITDGGGLRLGSSFNSLGLTKDSEISSMSHEEAAQHASEIEQFLSSRRREHAGDPLSYTVFYL